MGERERARERIQNTKRVRAKDMGRGRDAEHLEKDILTVHTSKEVAGDVMPPHDVLYAQLWWVNTKPPLLSAKGDTNRSHRKNLPSFLRESPQYLNAATLRTLRSAAPLHILLPVSGSASLQTNRGAAQGDIYI